MADTIKVKVCALKDRVRFTDASGKRVLKTAADGEFDMPTGEYNALGPNGRNVVKAAGPARVQTPVKPAVAPDAESKAS